jgi:hypothetical protein
MVVAPSSTYGGWVEEIGRPLNLDNAIEEPLGAFFLTHDHLNVFGGSFREATRDTLKL